MKTRVYNQIFDSSTQFFFCCLVSVIPAVITAFVCLVVVSLIFKIWEILFPLTYFLVFIATIYFVSFYFIYNYLTSVKLLRQSTDGSICTLKFRWYWIWKGYWVKPSDHKLSKNIDIEDWCDMHCDGLFYIVKEKSYTIRDEKIYGVVFKNKSDASAFGLVFK